MIYDRQHCRGHAKLGCPVQVGSRTGEELHRLKMASLCREHECRLPEPIECVDVGTSRDLGS
jgi:hypothetical protein